MSDSITYADLNAAIPYMDNGRGMMFDKKENSYDLIIRGFGTDELVELSKNEKLAHAICFANRPGAEYFYNCLEYTWFEPDTPANKEYQFRLFKFEHMLYSIGSIPAEKREYFDIAAEKAGLKVQKGAVPFVIGIVRGSLNPAKTEGFSDDLTKEVQWFPLKSPTVSTLETKSGSPIYEGPGGDQDAHAEQEIKLKQFFDRIGVSWERYKERFRR